MSWEKVECWTVLCLWPPFHMAKVTLASLAVYIELDHSVIQNKRIICTLLQTIGHSCNYNIYT